MSAITERTGRGRAAPRPASIAARRGQPHLTREDEVEIARGIARGSLETRNRLVVMNLGFVAKLAREYINKGLPMEDLLNEGCIGLIHAAARFDHTKGTRFITYAAWWVRKSILKALGEQAWTIRVPTYHRKVMQIRRADAEVGLWRRSAGPREEVPAGSTGLAYGFRMVSLEAAVTLESRRRLMETLVDGATLDPENEVIHRESLDLLVTCLADLGEREREVLARRFGLSGAPVSTLKEIADRMGLSRERVRQIESSATGKLRARLCEGRGRIRRSHRGAEACPPSTGATS